MGAYKRGRTWWIDYYHGDKRIRESVGPTKALAEKALRKRLIEIAEGTYFPNLTNKDIGFQELAERYWDLHGKYKRTKSYRLMLAQLVKHFGNKRISEIRPALVLEYRNKVKDRASVATANRHHSLLRAILYKAVEWDMLRGDNPAAKVKLEREQGHRLRFLSQEEITVLLQACDSRLYSIVVCAIWTGMRKGELLNLTWDNVDLEHNTIYIIQSKSGKPREVPISPRLSELFITMGPKREGRVFELAEITLRRYFPKALKRAGINDFRFHDLRHTFASHFIMKTNDMPALQKILGHHSPILTQRYAHLSRGHMLSNMTTFDVGMKTVVTNWSQLPILEHSSESENAIIPLVDSPTVAA